MNLTRNASLFTVFLLLAAAGCQPNAYREGADLYHKNCANCHMENGVGLGALIPPLAGADYLTQHRGDLPRIVRYGLKDSIQVNGKWYMEQMPGAPALSEIEVTNVLNYINNAWGNRYPDFTLQEVKAILEAPAAGK